jgi:hypothetical protein
MKMSLRDAIDGRISHMSDHIHQDDIDSCITDIFKLIEKGIDEIKELNTPEHWDNLNAREQVKISHYLLALDDVKEMLK